MSGGPRNDLQAIPSSGTTCASEDHVTSPVSVASTIKCRFVTRTEEGKECVVCIPNCLRLPCATAHYVNTWEQGPATSGRYFPLKARSSRQEYQHPIHSDRRVLSRARIANGPADVTDSGRVFPSVPLFARSSDSDGCLEAARG